MNYQDFLRLAMDASECETFDDYVAEVGGSIPEALEPHLMDALNDLYAYGRNRTISTIRKITGMSRAGFGREYKISIRTLEGWEGVGDERTAPAYVVDLIAFAAITDKYLSE